jgi:hypothetical protein
MKAFKYSILFATLLLARNPAHAETPASTDKDVAVSTTTAVINTGPGRAPLGLVPLKNLESESSLISAGRVVEIAAGELNANIGALQKEEAGLKKEIAAFEAARHLELVAFEPVRKAYEVRLAAYNLIKDPLEADIAAYNRRPQAQQDQATHDRLEARINALEAERKGLDVQKEAGDKLHAAAEARLRAISDRLQIKISRWNTEMGLAYRQLKLVADYARQINQKLEARYSKPGIKHPGYNPSGKYPVLDGALEQLKALAGRGFDSK